MGPIEVIKKTYGSDAQKAGWEKLGSETGLGGIMNAALSGGEKVAYGAGWIAGRTLQADMYAAKGIHRATTGALIRFEILNHLARYRYADVDVSESFNFLLGPSNSIKLKFSDFKPGSTERAKTETQIRKSISDGKSPLEAIYLAADAWLLEMFAASGLEEYARKSLQDKNTWTNSSAYFELRKIIQDFFYKEFSDFAVMSDRFILTAPPNLDKAFWSILENRTAKRLKNFLDPTKLANPITITELDPFATKSLTAAGLPANTEFDFNDLVDPTFIAQEQAKVFSIESGKVILKKPPTETFNKWFDAKVKPLLNVGNAVDNADPKNSAYVMYHQLRIALYDYYLSHIDTQGKLGEYIKQERDRMDEVNDRAHRTVEAKLGLFPASMFLENPKRAEDLYSRSLDFDVKKGTSKPDTSKPRALDKITGVDIKPGLSRVTQGYGARNYGTVVTTATEKYKEIVEGMAGLADDMGKSFKGNPERAKKSQKTFDEMRDRYRNAILKQLETLFSGDDIKAAGQEVIAKLIVHLQGSSNSPVGLRYRAGSADQAGEFEVVPGQGAAIMDWLKNDQTTMNKFNTEELKLIGLLFGYPGDLAAAREVGSFERFSKEKLDPIKIDAVVVTSEATRIGIVKDLARFVREAEAAVTAADATEFARVKTEIESILAEIKGIKVTRASVGKPESDAFMLLYRLLDDVAKELGPEPDASKVDASIVAAHKAVAKEIADTKKWFDVEFAGVKLPLMKAKLDEWEAMLTGKGGGGGKPGSKGGPTGPGSPAGGPGIGRPRIRKITGSSTPTPPPAKISTPAMAAAPPPPAPTPDSAAALGSLETMTDSLADYLEAEWKDIPKEERTSAKAIEICDYVADEIYRLDTKELSYKDLTEAFDKLEAARKALEMESGSIGTAWDRVHRTMNTKLQEVLMRQIDEILILPSDDEFEKAWLARTNRYQSLTADRDDLNFLAEILIDPIVDHINNLEPNSELGRIHYLLNNLPIAIANTKNEDVRTTLKRLDRSIAKHLVAHYEENGNDLQQLVGDIATVYSGITDPTEQAITQIGGAAAAGLTNASFSHSEADYTTALAAAPKWLREHAYTQTALEIRKAINAYDAIDIKDISDMSDPRVREVEKNLSDPFAITLEGNRKLKEARERLQNRIEGKKETAPLSIDQAMQEINSYLLIEWYYLSDDERSTEAGKVITKIVETIELIDETAADFEELLEFISVLENNSPELFTVKNIREAISRKQGELADKSTQENFEDGVVAIKARVEQFAKLPDADRETSPLIDEIAAQILALETDTISLIELGNQLEDALKPLKGRTTDKQLEVIGKALLEKLRGSIRLKISQLFLLDNIDEFEDQWEDIVAQLDTKIRPEWTEDTIIKPLLGEIQKIPESERSDQLELILDSLPLGPDPLLTEWSEQIKAAVEAKLSVDKSKTLEARKTEMMQDLEAILDRTQAPVPADEDVLDTLLYNAEVAKAGLNYQLTFNSKDLAADADIIKKLEELNTAWDDYIERIAEDTLRRLREQTTKTETDLQIIANAISEFDKYEASADTAGMQGALDEITALQKLYTEGEEMYAYTKLGTRVERLNQNDSKEAKVEFEAGYQKLYEQITKLDLQNYADRIAAVESGGALKKRIEDLSSDIENTDWLGTKTMNKTLEVLSERVAIVRKEAEGNTAVREAFVEFHINWNSAINNIVEISEKRLDARIAEITDNLKAFQSYVDQFAEAQKNFDLRGMKAAYKKIERLQKEFTNPTEEPTRAMKTFRYRFRLLRQTGEEPALTQELERKFEEQWVSRYREIASTNLEVFVQRLIKAEEDPNFDKESILDTVEYPVGSGSFIPEKDYYEILARQKDAGGYLDKYPEGITEKDSRGLTQNLNTDPGPVAPGNTLVPYDKAFADAQVTQQQLEQQAQAKQVEKSTDTKPEPWTPQVPVAADDFVRILAETNSRFQLNDETLTAFQGLVSATTEAAFLTSLRALTSEINIMREANPELIILGLDSPAELDEQTEQKVLRIHQDIDTLSTFIEKLKSLAQNDAVVNAISTLELYRNTLHQQVNAQVQQLYRSNVTTES